ncbi:hypothetical protein ACFLRX_08020 [Acidobacteriota bacterium]
MKSLKEPRDMAYYKKTSNNEESKTPLTVHNSKSQNYFQGKEKGSLRPTFHNSKSHSSKNEVELFRKALKGKKN